MGKSILLPRLLLCQMSSCNMRPVIRTPSVSLSFLSLSLSDSFYSFFLLYYSLSLSFNLQSVTVSLLNCYCDVRSLIQSKGKPLTHYPTNVMFVYLLDTVTKLLLNIPLKTDLEKTQIVVAAWKKHWNFNCKCSC